MLSAAQETGLWTHGASLPAPYGALEYKTQLYRQAGVESYKHFYITVNWNVNKRQNAFCGSSSAFYVFVAFRKKKSYCELMGKSCITGPVTVFCLQFCHCHFFFRLCLWWLPQDGRAGGKGGSTWADWELTTTPWLHTPLWTCQLMFICVCVCVFMWILDEACGLVDCVAQYHVQPNSSLRGLIYELGSDGRQLGTKADLTDMEISFGIIYLSVSLCIYLCLYMTRILLLELLWVRLRQVGHQN